MSSINISTQELVNYEVVRARTRLARRRREVVEQQMRTVINPEAARQLEALAAQATEAGNNELALELLVAASGHKPASNTLDPTGF